MAEPHELSGAECDRLLRSGVVGRVAITTPDGPHIVPVNYSVVDDMIVFRTSPYSLVGRYGMHAQVAFEVDHFDYDYALGWSVMAKGRSDAVAEVAEVERINRVWSPRPWVSGQRNLYLALRWTELTGLRIGPSLGSQRDLPVERRGAGL